MAVMMQAFYWDSPIKEQKEGEWWNYLAEKTPELAATGFNAVWLPPIAMEGMPAMAGTNASPRCKTTVAWISAFAEMTVECNEAGRPFGSR